MKNKIFVVDDERIIRLTLADDLREKGFEVREFADGYSVLAALLDETPNIIITDLKMPGMDGFELLLKVKEKFPQICVIVMTAYATIENAINAMKSGAFDYIMKPFNIEEILNVVKHATEIIELKKENAILSKCIENTYDFSAFIGDHESNKQFFDYLSLISIKDSTVLINGETGTGKELITNIIHYNSTRKKKPLVKVSCAILSKDIFESELFGHVKGAFTGADSDKTGRFELANNGTIYLDDIDDIPLDLQVKLLRVIEQREIEKVGSSNPIPVDVRVIASTKKDIRKLVDEGKFREDLYYRLNVVPIYLPPLRERKKDIPILFTYFLQKYTGSDNFKIDKEVNEILLQYKWPGNVRELKNIAERISIISAGGIITKSLFPLEIQMSVLNSETISDIDNPSLNESVERFEKNLIISALLKFNNNITKSAEFLKTPHSTLRSKIEKYHIKI